jgi:glycosyltransferase involved in cell wall biosynthesis
MKVGLYIGGISPTSGGGNTYVTELLAALSRARGDCGHELILCHHRASEHIAQLYPEFRNLNFDDEMIGVLSKWEVFLGLLPVLAQRSYRFVCRPPVTLSWEDRLYSREGIHFIIRLSPWNASTNIPFATAVWDLQHRNSPWFPEVSLLQEWDDRESGYASLRRASFIYTGTHQGRAEISLYYQIPVERIKVLPFAAPAFAVRAAHQSGSSDLVKSLALPADYVFYPAQFWPHKNHVLLLEACKIVREATDWDLTVVFSGADKGNLDYVRDYASRLGLKSRTRFLGFVDQAELVELYRGAFCLAFPTFFGPDNLPPLEAFAIGCPVLASDVPGAREQLGDAAIFFSPADERTLAGAIMSLREPGLRERLVRAGHARAQMNTWDEYAKGIIDSLDEFAAVRRTWR